MTDMTDKAGLLERLCAYWNKMPAWWEIHGGAEASKAGEWPKWMPETLLPSMPCASAALKSALTDRRNYVDGSGSVSVTAELTVRTAAVSVRQKLDVMAMFDALRTYMAENPLREEAGNGSVLEVQATSGTEKTALLEDGAEEYRMTASVRVYYAGAGKTGQ